MSLEDIMAPLGAAAQYNFGTQLIQEQRPGTDNSQFRTDAIPTQVDALLNANRVRYIGLECLEAPDEGGETLIASSRAFFAPRRGIRIEYWSRVSGFDVERSDGNPIVAPVQVDPVTGGDALWVGLDCIRRRRRHGRAGVRGTFAFRSSKAGDDEQHRERQAVVHVCHCRRRPHMMEGRSGEDRP